MKSTSPGRTTGRRAPPAQESVWDLLERAQGRAVEYMSCAQETWMGDKTGEDLLRLTRNRSYSSDAPNSAQA